MPQKVLGFNYWLARFDVITYRNNKNPVSHCVQCDRLWNYWPVSATVNLQCTASRSDKESTFTVSRVLGEVSGLRRGLFEAFALLDCLTLQNRTDRLSRNAGNQLPTYAVKHTRRAKASACYLLTLVICNLWDAQFQFVRDTSMISFSLQANATVESQISSWLFPSTSCPAHYSHRLDVS
jgi:hypothetical protein